MTRLEQLLECDAANAPQTVAALKSVRSDCFDVVERGAVAFDECGRLFGEASQYDRHHSVVEEWASRLGFVGNDAFDFLRDATIVGAVDTSDATARAQAELHEATSILARGHLALRLGRDFLFAVTDLLRLRLSPVMGYLRSQAETAGLLRLMVTEKTLAEWWFQTVREESGKDFYNRWNGRIRNAIRDLDLSAEYERGSNMAFHARASGTALGTLLGHKGAKRGGAITLAYQEADDPRLVFFWLSVILQCQRKVLRRADAFFPEVSRDALHLAASGFLDSEARLTAQARRIYSSLSRVGVARALLGE